MLDKQFVNDKFDKYKQMVNDIIFKKYSYRVANDYDDMYQIGCEGLIHGIKHWNPNKGIAESTYYYTVISNTLKHLDVYIDNFAKDKHSIELQVRQYIITNKEMSFDDVIKSCPYGNKNIIENVSYKIQ